MVRGKEMNKRELADILNTIEFNGWRFLLRYEGATPYLQIEFQGTCNVSGKPDNWRGRKWRLSPHMTKGEVVQTAFLATMTAVEHETREQFKFDGVSVFDPHYDIDKLVELRRSEDALKHRHRALAEVSNVSGLWKAWTDGSCSPNPGPGGYAFVMQSDSGQIYESGGRDPETTNNRMEMMAAIAALRAIPDDSKIKIHTDSQYLQKGITSWIRNWKANNWRKRGGKPVKNHDLWQELDALCQSRAVHWAWVRGHDGNAGNERADELAGKYATGELPA